MIDYVKKIATSNQTERRNAILDILRDCDIPFCTHRVKENKHFVENIVIPLNPQNDRLVIGAHYDSVDRSTGANDNASGVSVLIELAKKLIKENKQNIELVLFDREEYEDHGSSAYIKWCGKQNIRAMVNIDMCGFGDTTVIVTKGNLGNPAFEKLLNPKILAKHNIICIDSVPFPISDDERFDENSICNIAIETMLEWEAKAYIAEIPKLKENGNIITKALREILDNMESKKTFHNAVNDNIDSVSEKTMEMVYNYLVDGLL